VDDALAVLAGEKAIDAARSNAHTFLAAYSFGKPVEAQGLDYIGPLVGLEQRDSDPSQKPNYFSGAVIAGGQTKAKTIVKTRTFRILE